MIHEFIQFGGVLFWIIVGFITLILSAQVNDEKAGYAGLTLILTLVAVLAFTNVPLIDTIKTHPLYVLYAIGGYVIAAGVWALAKWRLFFLPNLFDRYDDLRSDFMKSKGLKEIPADPNVRDQLKEFIRGRGLYIETARMVRNNKGRITTWMLFWPFSFIGTFVGDFLQRVFATLYKGIAGMLQRMSDSMASKYSELD